MRCFSYSGVLDYSHENEGHYEHHNHADLNVDAVVFVIFVQNWRQSDYNEKAERVSS